MGKKTIGIRDVANIGVADIDVYNTNRAKFDNYPSKYAEKVKLRIGVFFDGTGNNSYNSDAVYYTKDLPINETAVPVVTHKGFKVKSDSSYWNRYSNVKLLHDLYEEITNRNVDKDIKVQELQLKVYVQGIGTLRDAEDDTFGTAFGEGERGVIARVEEACRDVAKVINEELIILKSNKPFYIESIEFDVFGFSRGAAAARHFCNEVLKQGFAEKEIKIKRETNLIVKDKINQKTVQIPIDNNQIQKPVNLGARPAKEFTGGKLGIEFKNKNINYPAQKVAVSFLGLFDTVIAQLLEKTGVIDFARNNPYLTVPLSLHPALKIAGAGAINKVGSIKKVNPDVSNPNIKKVFQIEASNEWRENFALTPIAKYAYRKRISVLGAHSNIGGCYNDTLFERNTLHFFDISVDATATEVAKANDFKIQLRQWYIDNLFCQDSHEVIAWEIQHHVEICEPIGINPVTNEIIYNRLNTKAALLNSNILGNETEKIVEGKKYVLRAYHNALKSKRKLNNKLSLVYMNVMKHIATKFANVPFLEPTDSDVKVKQPSEYKFDKNYKLDEYFAGKETYQSLMIKVAEHGWAVDNEKPIEHDELFTKENGQLTYKVPLSLYEDVKRNYVHLSANFNATFPKAEILGEYQFAYPYVPNLTFDKEYKNPPYFREEYTPKIDASDKK